MNGPVNPFDTAYAPDAADPFVLDLGSDAAMPDPFAQPQPPPATQPAQPVAQPAVQEQPAQPTPPAPQPSQPAPQTPVPEPEGANPLIAAMEQQEQTSVFAKPPVFEHGSVTEDIADVTQTFDELRIAKAEDFPELEDAKRVTWHVTYGKITKTVTPMDAKKQKIGELKTSIETSKEFISALKTSKDKSPRCVVKPRVTAQSKGDALALPSYKGFFTDIADAYASGKPISIVPGNDGHLYEMRRSELGTFTTRTANCKELCEIRAGFIPALPLIPRGITLSVIGFFRSLITANWGCEALVNIMWDRILREFTVYVPNQTVTHTRTTADTTDIPDPARYLHYADIHSHNTMPAKFSKIDDEDEKATRVYAVFGQLDSFIPDISVRISNGGKYFEIEPSVVFAPMSSRYPEEWNGRVSRADPASTEARRDEI